MLSIIWTINIFTFAYIFIGPLVSFHCIFSIMQMIFWGFVCLTLAPMKSDGTYVLTPGSGYFSEATESAMKHIRKYIFAAFQAGVNIVVILAQMIWQFVVLTGLCLGFEINLGGVTFSKAHTETTKINENRLARLDAALSWENIWRKGYTFIARGVVYLVDEIRLAEIEDFKREYSGHMFQFSVGADECAVEITLEKMYGEAEQKFFESVEFHCEPTTTGSSTGGECSSSKEQSAECTSEED